MSGFTVTYPVWLIISTDEEVAKAAANSLRYGFRMTYTRFANELEDRASAVEGPTVQSK